MRCFMLSPKITTKKITVEENEIFSAQSPQKRIAKVQIYLTGGNILGQQIDYAKGDPENPMSREELRTKAKELLGDNRAQQIESVIYS